MPARAQDITPAGGPAAAVCAALASAAPARPGAQRARLYAVKSPLGRERALAGRLSRLAPEGLLLEAFAPMRERWFRRGGAWSLQARPMWPGYALAMTCDPEALAALVRGMSAPAWPAGPAPLDPEVASWLLEAAEPSRAARTLRGSVAHILPGGRLRVVSGPLVGREAQIIRYDRHKRGCLVALTSAGASGPCECLALDIPPAPEGGAPACR